MKRDHTRYLEMASAYFEETLTPHAKQIFEHHCETCEECRKAFRQLKNLHHMVSEHGDVTVPPYFMTRLHARLKEQMASVDPWTYEAKRLLPLFSILAVFLLLLLLFRPDSDVFTPDDYYLGSQTPVELRVLSQKKAFTSEEIFVLAMTKERREE
jgi:hypothetical protein